MKLRVIRDTKTSISTIGKLYVDGTFYAHTLEPPIKASGKPRAIGCGTYPLTMRMSAHWHRPMPHIDKVPDFSEVEIHIGNFAHDTKACLLPGASRGPMADFIGESAKVFEPLRTLLIETPGPHEITYDEAFDERAT